MPFAYEGSMVVCPQLQLIDLVFAVPAMAIFCCFPEMAAARRRLLQWRGHGWFAGIVVCACSLLASPGP